MTPRPWHRAPPIAIFPAMPLSDMHPQAASSTPKPAKAPPRPPRATHIRREPGGTRVTFGTATVTTRKPARAEVEHNVEASTEALRRAGDRLARPGIRLPARKNVPLFEADPDRPGGFLRRLNGRTERGILENGRFTVTD
ncbi:hypothetical protein [Roseomonas sp. KE2513]|uniref:hypothetical protein n=1 Tax=Roseomonas sp. KE2513 TaxID=2479202 RepID=UPI0018DFB161|nr:hypothetical protein [Roseomonas sp. KE2513]